jgi:hypothetical protein
MMEAESTPETSLNVYQPTRRIILEDSFKVLRVLIVT